MIESQADFAIQVQFVFCAKHCSYQENAFSDSCNVLCHPHEEMSVEHKSKKGGKSMGSCGPHPNGKYAVILSKHCSYFTSIEQTKVQQKPAAVNFHFRTGKKVLSNDRAYPQAEFFLMHCFDSDKDFLGFCCFLFFFFIFLA